MNPEELHWIAGFIEGEGSFMFYGAGFGICAVQKQIWPLEKLRTLCGGNIHPMRDKRYATCYKWTLYGRPAVALAKSLDLLMSPRRQDQLRTAIGGWMLKPSSRREHCEFGHRIEGAGRARKCRLCANIKARAKRARRETRPRRPRLRVAVSNG